jgi:hypothetical protein
MLDPPTLGPSRERVASTVVVHFGAGCGDFDARTSHAENPKPDKEPDRDSHVIVVMPHSLSLSLILTY